MQDHIPGLTFLDASQLPWPAWHAALDGGDGRSFGGSAGSRVHCRKLCGQQESHSCSEVISPNPKPYIPKSK